jgi:hypothetical protein
MERELTTYTKHNLHVTVASDEIWFPVYEVAFGRVTDRAVATLERPHRGQPNWRAFVATPTETVEVGQGRIVGPRTALNQIHYALKDA